jgi:hypothetical protein
LIANRAIAQITTVLTAISTNAPARMPSLIAEPSGELQIGHAIR